MAAVMLNFNKAAEALNLAQSTVSAQVKSLEDELGELLFKRIHKKIVLTDAGETMLFYANKMLSIEEEARANISNKLSPVGTIRLLVPEAVASTYLPGVLNKYLSLHPFVNFDISNCSQSGLENELRTESVDFAFIFSKHIDSINLHSEIVLVEDFVIVTRADSYLSSKIDVDISDLNGQTVLLPKAGCGHGLLLKQMLNLDIVKPSSVIESTSVEAIKNYIKENDCIAVLPRISIQDELLKKHIVELDWPNKLTIEVIMVWHKNRILSPTLLDFMELARNMRD